MNMTEYMLQTFEYNNKTNLKLINKIGQMPDPVEAIRLFSHLINSQLKWMARIMGKPKSHEMSWWDPVYDLAELKTKWTESLQPFVDLIKSKSEEQLFTEVTFIGYDGGMWAASPGDVVLQLNYHSIHHRAQIQTLLRQQGITPDFVDYIATKYRKLES